MTKSATLPRSQRAFRCLATRARPRIGHHPHFTDKMPLNYLYCGLIQRARPNARIIQVTRHPLATCYAVLKTLFNQGYPCSYDLSELAEYYIAYHRLMDHWRQVMPERILDVSYERLRLRIRPRRQSASSSSMA
jgi:Sulfotransferase family